jgi:multiple sugar transport system permease protein
MFVKSIFNTFIYAFFRVGFSLLWAFLVALAINRKFRGNTLLKLLIYIPCVLPAVASGLLFQLAFFQEKSIFVYLVHSVFGGKEFALNTRQLAMPSLIITGTVYGVGGNMILLLAALNGVPQDVMEAALLDGATSWQKFFKITLPMISSTLFFMLVTGFIGALQAYAEIELVVGKSEYTMTMAMFVVDNSFYGIGIGYALAASWVIFFIILIFTLVFYKSTIKRVYFGGDQ